MTVTDTRVQVKRKGSSRFTTIAGATFTPGDPPDYLRVALPTTFKPAAGDVLRTVFTVVKP